MHEEDLGNKGVFVRLVTLQFSFSNWNAVPSCIKRVPDETDEEFTERFDKKLLSANERLQQPTLGPIENCSLEEFVEDLEEEGYELVDSFVKGRPKDGRWYPMVRFTFAYHQFATPSDEFLEVWEENRAALRSMVTESFWRVRVTPNLYYRNRKFVRGHHTLSVNLEARIPRFQGGVIKTQWKRDEAGEKIGNGPVPLVPKFDFRIVDGEVALIAVE